MRNRVEVFGQIGIDYMRVARPQKCLHFLDGVLGASLRSIAIGMTIEVRFKDRFQQQLRAVCTTPVPNSRDTEQPFVPCLFLSLRFAGQVNLILRRRALPV